MRVTKIFSHLFLVALWTSIALCQEIATPHNTVEADIPALIRESALRSSENWLVRQKYISDFTYKFRLTQRNTGKAEESEMYELYFPDTKRQNRAIRSVQVLLEKNGKPIPPERIEEARRKAGEKLEKLENAGPAKGANTPPAMPWMSQRISLGGGKSASVDVAEIMATCDFHAPRRTRVNDRETIVLDFRPRPDAKFGEHTRYMSQVEGSIWIDVQDQVVIRCAGWSKTVKPAQSERDETLASAAFLFELVKVKEGIWQPRRDHINGAKYPELFSSLKNIELLTEYFDYQYFGVGIEKEQIKAPIQKL